MKKVIKSETTKAVITAVYQVVGIFAIAPLMIFATFMGA